MLSYPACVTASAATSTLRTADAKLLKPSASSLEHLARTIRTCQDALSGFLDDDASLTSSSQFVSMSIEAAAEAVQSCLTVTMRAFARPHRLDEDANAGWSMKEVKVAKNTLSQRLDDLISSQLIRRCESFISSTPNRVSLISVETVDYCLTSIISTCSLNSLEWLQLRVRFVFPIMCHLVHLSIKCMTISVLVIDSHNRSNICHMQCSHW